MTYMKFQSILFIILVVTLASCQGSKSTPAVQDIDLFVGSKQITNVYVDAVKVDLSTSDVRIPSEADGRFSHCVMASRSR